MLPAPDQLIVFTVLIVALGLFIWGRWRYDVVALTALVVLVLTGLVPEEKAFSGFGHPAVITVAAILILSQALTSSGAVEVLGKRLLAFQDKPVLQIAALTSLVAVSSAVMNNVGALALFMPLALQLCRRSQRSPSEVLMPLSFASLLGGLLTLIGTPPNIIIASYREHVQSEPFRMFDFAPVGLGVALVGVIFISLIGWRLLPRTPKGGNEPHALFEINAYITETRLPENAKLVGKALRELERIGKGDVAILALVRGKRRLLAPGPFEQLKANDRLILEGHPDSLKNMVDDGGLELESGAQAVSAEELISERVGLFEAVVSPGSRIEGRSARMMQLHERFGVNLLAISRQGAPIRQRIGRVIFRAGDVLLLQGDSNTMGDTLAILGCLPLARRNIKLTTPRRVLPSVGIFAAAILTTALGLTPAPVAFVTGALALIISNQLSLREAYMSIEWPIIVLLGAMIPVGGALESSGATTLLALRIVDFTGNLPIWAILGILMMTAMALSDVINNAATAVIMAPIATSVAGALGHPVDPFLMCVAVGSSCTFLTPIGHQSNTLVMGPGGYAFSDYWKMGLPLGILVVVTATPLILVFWPI
jgi:di/tricarboxylate transporter